MGTGEEQDKVDCMDYKTTPSHSALHPQLLNPCYLVQSMPSIPYSRCTHYEYYLVLVMPDPAPNLWPIHTLRTWKQHLREADDDEKVSITLATRSDTFRAFIATSAASTSASNESGTAGHARLTLEAEDRPQLPSQGDGHQNQMDDHMHMDKVADQRDADERNHQCPADVDDGLGDFCSDDRAGDFRGDDGTGDVHGDDSPGDVRGDDGAGDVCGDDGPRDFRGNDGAGEFHCNNSPGDSCNHDPPAGRDDDRPPAPPICSPLLDLDIEKLICDACLPKIWRSLHFVKDIRNASLNDGVGITGEPLECLHNPP
ncbi:hypothetical protein BKA82DRAFT_4014428 [Pisolithus tinctorius]|nr:hypothetical protein BKA82DRAFT_4014428 [Pisolithus tinctorius]